MTSKVKNKIHWSIKEALRLDFNTSDREVIRHCKKVASIVCKPCWEIKYCPYGPLVEQFPCLPPLRDEVIPHNEYLIKILKDDKFPDGSKIDAKRRFMFEEDVKTFNADDYPTEIPSEAEDLACNMFGHICPVFFRAENISETNSGRRTGRYIPFKIKMRVVRRDNHTCQRCGKHLRDNEVEFDHIIPLSKGGSSEEQNIRLTCYDCNREKKDKIDI